MLTKLIACVMMADSYTRDLSVYTTAGGRLTASGALYTDGAVHCASNSWPLWTVLKVTYRGKTLTLAVKDRMGQEHSRDGTKRLDMTLAAWRFFAPAGPLGLLKRAKVEVVKLGDGRYRRGGVEGSRGGRVKRNRSKASRRN